MFFERLPILQPCQPNKMLLSDIVLHREEIFRQFATFGSIDAPDGAGRTSLTTARRFISGLKYFVSVEKFTLDSEGYLFQYRAASFKEGWWGTKGTLLLSHNKGYAPEEALVSPDKEITTLVVLKREGLSPDPDLYPACAKNFRVSTGPICTCRQMPGFSTGWIVS